MRSSVHTFLTTSNSFSAQVVQFIIVILVLLSASSALVELLVPNALVDVKPFLIYFEHVVLFVFTVELLVRLVVTPSLGIWIRNPVNWIDVMAVVPFYFGIENTVVLRILRVLRILKLIDFERTNRALSIFDFKNSILRVVSPLIITFVFIKGLIWFLEAQGWWIIETDFDTLFTIIGFALGVVLSQKIGRSYVKYLAVHNDTYLLLGKLQSLQEDLNLFKKGTGDKLVKEWLTGFLETYNGKLSGSVTQMRRYNRNLYQTASKHGNSKLLPFHRIATSMQGIFELAISIQSQRTNQTPLAYNVLLQQTTIMYLLLLVLFIPGMKGMISVVFAGYLLYGMYQITNDFDDVIGDDDEDGSTNLIRMDAMRIRNYLKELEAGS